MGELLGCAPGPLRDSAIAGIALRAPRSDILPRKDRSPPCDKEGYHAGRALPVSRPPNACGCQIPALPPAPLPSPELSFLWLSSLRFQKLLHDLQSRNARLASAAGCFERGGGGSEADAFGQAKTASEHGRISSVKHISAAGSVHRLHFERGLMAGFPASVQIPASLRAASPHRDPP